MKKLRQDVPAMKDVYTNRWNINSSEIIGGDEDTIKQYQNNIIAFYNDSLATHQSDFKLHEYHGPMLRIEPKSHVIKGVVNICKSVKVQLIVTTFICFYLIQPLQ